MYIKLNVIFSISSQNCSMNYCKNVLTHVENTITKYIDNYCIKERRMRDFLIFSWWGDRVFVKIRSDSDRYVSRIRNVPRKIFIPALI